jgi:hypothetical protein
VKWPVFVSYVASSSSAALNKETPAKKSYEEQQEHTRWNRTVERYVSLVSQLTGRRGTTLRNFN